MDDGLFQKNDTMLIKVTNSKGKTKWEEGVIKCMGYCSYIERCLAQISSRAHAVDVSFTPEFPPRLSGSSQASRTELESPPILSEADIREVIEMDERQPLSNVAQNEMVCIAIYSLRE